VPFTEIQNYGSWRFMRQKILESTTPRGIPGIVWVREDLKVPLKDFFLRVALTKPTTYPDAIQSGSVGFRV
jgi:hypothetical protein